MITLKASRDLRPISDLKSSGADIVRQVNQTGRPVVLTRHGRGVAVLLTVEQYEHLYERLEALERRLAAEGVEPGPIEEDEVSCPDLPKKTDFARLGHLR